MSAAPARVLPIRLPPQPGEPLDSWVAAYAARLDTPIQDLAAGLGPGTGFWRQPAADVALGKGVGALVGLTAAAGVSDEQVEAMWRPLARYRHLVRPRFASSGLRWMVLPLRWSRFCPACLADTSGRWQTRWRLPWQLACPTHTTLLCSRCARCDGRQRQKALLQDVDTAQTMTCDVPTPAASGRGDHRCGNDLCSTTAEPTGLWRLLDFQERLTPLLIPSTADARMTVLIEDLADVLTVAHQRDLIPGPTTSQGLCETATLADAVDRANETLRGAGQNRLRELALADMRGRPQPLPRSWRAASTTLAGRVLATRDTHLRPTDQLRWRTTTTGARPTITGDDSRLGCVPTALWPEWVVRLQPPGDYNPITFSKVAAASLLLPGATRSFAAVLSDWTSDATLSRASATVLGKLVATEHGDTILRSLTQLSDGLLAHGSPIDYQRRRQLAATATLMDAADWDRICAQAGMATGGARKLRCARLWTWETVTAGLLEQAPDSIRPSEPEHIATYHRFPLVMSPLAAELLDAHARRLLDATGCADEPTSWSPPTEWVTVASLPGPDPACITAEQVEALLRQRLPASKVADRLGVTLQHVRLVIRRHPPQLRLRSTGRRPTMRNNFPAELTPERLRQLVVDDRRSLRSIRAGTSVTKHALRSALQRDGIPSPPSGRIRVKVDEGWLRSQYLEEHRTLPDIAAELGISPSNLSRIARQHQIPLRPRGGASHAASISAPSGWPLPLAAAVLGQAGRQRVERFQVYARARSINQGAARLSTTTPVLLSQLVQLENACRGTLIERSTSRHEAQRLSPLGERLLEQADQHLGPNPAAPTQLPEPLSSALSSFWGSDRLRRFEVAARSPSLVDAAAALATDVHTLDQSLRGLESACRGALMARDSPRSPHR
ncbi:MAG TPA: TniQ family protein, partial [Acidimicrobiales bacterium]|nr:TniQ family protein [Acidimicrobiales bacterium]